MNTENKFDHLVDKVMSLPNIFNLESISRLKAECFVENMQDWSMTGSIDDLKVWFLRCQKACQMAVKIIPLDECRSWYLDGDGAIKHTSGEFFMVQGVRVSNTKEREVTKGWDQPIVTQVGYDGGILGLVRAKIDGVPHYLIEAKYEPGNPDKVQICPTLQATFSNLKQAHGGTKPKFSDLFTDLDEFDNNVIFKQWFSEDGGRLNSKRNLGIIIQINDVGIFHDVEDNYRWVSLFQLKNILSENSWVSPHIRSLISVL